MSKISDYLKSKDDPTGIQQPVTQETNKLGYVTMEEIKTYFGDIEWSWPDRIPIGHVTMIVGPQGVGKSYLMASLISVWTGAQPNWPDGQPFKGKPGKVMLVETEQMRGEYVTRLRRLGVKNEKVIFPVEDEDDPTYTIDLIPDLEDIEILAKQTNCVAIGIDSLSGGHDLDENSNEMRKLLKGLVSLAGKLQIPVVVIHHPRKKSARESPRVTLDRVRGSSTITQFCRSIIGVCRLAEEQDSAVRVDFIKATFCKPPRPFGFTINEQGLTFGEAPEELKSMSAIEIASEFLLNELSKGPRRSSELIRLGKEQGIKRDAIYRAGHNIGVVNNKGTWQITTINGVAVPGVR